MGGGCAEFVRALLSGGGCAAPGWAWCWRGGVVGFGLGRLMLYSSSSSGSLTDGRFFCGVPAGSLGALVADAICNHTASAQRQPPTP